MAILKRVSNGKGDGAGRSRYALDKAVAVRTDIPSPLSLLLDGKLSSELRSELASEFNRHLLLHQGDYRTQHFVVSFGHRLNKKEIEEALDRLENLFNDPLRLHLFVVHQEEHGTAIHIIESASPDGKLRHLSRKEFFELKRAVIRELQPFMNEREKEVAKNFEKGAPTVDWKHQVELKGEERSWKAYIRKTVEQVTSLIEEGKVNEAVELLREKGIELVEVKAGGLSPTGKRTKRNNLYAVLKQGVGLCLRLNKKMKATFERYRTVFEEFRREARGVSERAGRYLEENRRAQGFEEEIRELYSELEKVRRVREQLGEIVRELSEELGGVEGEFRESEERVESGHSFGNLGRGEERGREVREKPKGVFRGAGKGVRQGYNENLLLPDGERGAELSFGADSSNLGRAPEVEGRACRNGEKNREGAGEYKEGAELFGTSELGSMGRDSLPAGLGTGVNCPEPLYYIAKVENRAVISDDKAVLEKLGAWGIEEVSNADEFARYWKRYRCRGSVLLYAQRKPEWLNEGLKKAVWVEVDTPVWATRPFEEEIRPFSLEQKAYFKVNGEVVLEDEIKRNPQRYLESSHPEIRRLAEEEKLRELRIKSERNKGRDYDYGPEL